MTTGKKQPPVVSLQENVSAFFDSFFQKYSAEMNCGRSCSKCCIFGLSVFPSEAQVILNWMNHLSNEEKLSFKEVLLGPKEQFDSVDSQRCVFLRNDLCSIYPVRPTVCRTQGLPLKIASVSDNCETPSEKFELSLCELNFQNEERLPAPSEWLDLERLNTLLSIADKYSETTHVSQDIIAIVEVSTGRVRLSRLHDLLLQKLI